MLLLSLIRAIFMALATYVIVALTLDTAGAWHWINPVVFTGVWFVALVAADFAEDMLLRWFNRNEPEATLTREGYRDGF